MVLTSARLKAALKNRLMKVNPVGLWRIDIDSVCRVCECLANSHQIRSVSEQTNATSRTKFLHDNADVFDQIPIATGHSFFKRFELRHHFRCVQSKVGDHDE